MVNKVLRLGGCGAFVLFITYLARPGSSLFSWHPFLMTLAYTGFMTEAMYTFSKSGLASGQPHSTKVTTHWALLAAVATVHGLGWAAIYFTKEANNKPHLTSWHGCLGCLASILLWVQLSGGIFAKYPKLIANVLPLRTLRSWHSLSGFFVYTVGVIALILSLGSPWYKSVASDGSVYAALGLHMVLVVGVLKGHVS